MLGLKLLLRGLVVVDQGKSCGTSSTKVGPETENRHLLGIGLVEGSKLLLKVDAGDVGTPGVDDIDDKLAAAEKTVGDELAGAQGNGGCVGLDEEGEQNQRRGPTCTTIVSPLTICKYGG